MNFTQSIEAGLSQYAEFDGRASRAEYWYWLLFLLVVVGTLTGADALLGSGHFLAILSVVPFIIPTAAVQVRRLHDMDMNGALGFICLIPFAFLILLAISARKGSRGRNRHGI